MSEPLVIQSFRGPYQVVFDEQAIFRLNASPTKNLHFIIDDRVAARYASLLPNVLNAPSCLRIPATEENKSFDKFSDYIQHLVSQPIRRGDTIIAIGGGIIQDIAVFLAATLLRGIDWQFYPTTLLAQADSCIGSKSSINFKSWKNLLGTFTPPKVVYVCTQFLDTLGEPELRSGVGEMIKVHVIDGKPSVNRMLKDYDLIFGDRKLMRQYIETSLRIKKKLIEEDEFDQGIRNILNYGHSFGHAIESATDFAIPHGVAVTIGMDLANFFSYRRGSLDGSTFESLHFLMAKNYRGYESITVPVDRFFSALSKDKKNIGEKLALILLNESGTVSKQIVDKDTGFEAICGEYLNHGRTQ